MESSELPLSWLLGKDQPVVRYHALVDLLGLPEDNEDVEAARSEMAKRGWASRIFAAQRAEGHWESRKSLYRPKYTATNWMALILADFGVGKGDVRIERAAELFFRDWMKDGDQGIFGDEVCIVGNTARMLTKFGYGDDPKVRRLYGRLVEDQKEDGGWHCQESATGSLDCWEALAAFAALPKARRTRGINRSIERGVEFYLERKLFDDGGPKYLPWFRFHYPVHYYYDILVGLDVITALGHGGDRRLKPALEVVRKKRQKDGGWLLDRVHPDPPSYAWGRHNRRWKAKPFRLEQEGRPSKWITLTTLRVLKRVDEAGVM